jgi:gamma-glutamyl:cysteine ligase YbdK (ATP-grasp superfamily)
MLEENMWRAIRWGLRGELIDLDAGRSVPARDRLEALIEQVADVAADLGIAPHLRVLLGPTAAERYASELEEGSTVHEVWPHAVQRTRDSVLEWLAVREEETG